MLLLFLFETENLDTHLQSQSGYNVKELKFLSHLKQNKIMLYEFFFSLSHHVVKLETKHTAGIPQVFSYCLFVL